MTFTMIDPPKLIALHWIRGASCPRLRSLMTACRSWRRALSPGSIEKTLFSLRLINEER